MKDEERSRLVARLVRIALKDATFDPKIAVTMMLRECGISPENLEDEIDTIIRNLEGKKEADR